MRALIVFSTLSLLAAAVHADPPPPIAESRARLLPIVPTVRLTAGTDNTAEILVALSLLTSARGWNVDIAPQLSVTTTNGISSLFSFGGSPTQTSSQWSAGLTLTFSGWRADPYLADRDKQDSALLQTAYERCNRRCPGTPQSPDDVRRFCEEAAGHPAPTPSFSRKNLCEEGKEVFESENSPVYPVWGWLPSYFISLGGVIGSQSFDYYLSNGNDIATPQHDNKVGGAAGLSLAYVGQFLKANAWSLEGAFTYGGRWAGSEVPVQWCEPSGQVASDGNAAPVAAQTCRNSVLGAPVLEQRVFGTVQLGFVDIHTDSRDHNKARTLWRGSIGPYVDYVWRDVPIPQFNLAGVKVDATGLLQVGVEIPLYLDLTTAIHFNSQSYHGLIRVRPAIAAEHSAQGWGPVAFVRVELLGDRYILNRALDW